MQDEKLKMILSLVLQQVKLIVGDDLSETILYGSYARGDYDVESDIDIALIIDLERRQVQMFRGALVEVISKMNMDYDVLFSIQCIPKNDFEQYKNDLPFYRAVDREGVRLVA